MWALGYDRGQAGYWDAIASRFSIVRLAGSDRYETAAKISAATYRPGVPVAYVATGTGFSDALAAGPVAAATGGPVVLVRPSDIPDATAAELRRPTRQDLSSWAGRAPSPTVSPRRCGRSRRPGGSIGSAGPTDTPPPLRCRPAPSSPASPWHSSGRDSTSLTRCPAQPPVGWTTDRSCLSGPNASRSRPRPSFDVSRRARSSSSVGGPAVISDAVLADLGGYSSSVVRVSGPDRYATAAKVSARTFEPGAAVAYVATGLDFPDALAGASAATVEDGPLLLAPRHRHPGGCTCRAAATEAAAHRDPRRLGRRLGVDRPRAARPPRGTMIGRDG